VKTYLTHIEKVKNTKADRHTDVLYMQEFSSIGSVKAREKLYNDYYITQETLAHV
jgi:hypothetical protein